MLPQILKYDGIFIDYGCKGIIPLDRGIWFPWYYDVGGERLKYIGEVNDFIKKWWYRDYKLDTIFKNEMEDFCHKLSLQKTEVNEEK